MRCPPMKFEENALKSLARVEAIFCERGTQYADTMLHCQFLFMQAVRDRFELDIPDEFLRALYVAGAVDVKYARMEGGYKDDNVMDGVAYQLFLAQEVKDLDEKFKEWKAHRNGITVTRQNP